MKKIPLIAANWKMNKTIKETIDFIKNISSEVTDIKASIFIAVPFTSISEASKASEKTKIIIGAQNMNDASKGAFTGEISAIMLEDAGAEFVIVGHSERRIIFKETDNFINKKVLRAIQDDIKPILCIGETKDQREDKERILKEQLEIALKDISKEDAEAIVIAYEPVWAIGTGESATSEIAEKTHFFIRKCLSEIFSKTIANKIYILYGGSVNEDNIQSLLKEKNIDGVLIGGASLEEKSFLNILKKL